MGPKGTLRAIEAAVRRAEREAQRRQRELARQAKEQAKLSELERARLEVETYENRIDVLLSIHKEQGKTWDWASVLSALPPPPPRRLSNHELRAKQTSSVLPPDQRQQAEALIEQARLEDDKNYDTEVQAYRDQVSEIGHLKRMARRILDGEAKAYTQALTELSAFGEISDLGSSIHVTVHSPKLIECCVKINGRNVIPNEVKTLTSTGKVSVKPISKARFQEIYADYICGCALRVAREVIAVLPIETVLVTASADSVDQQTGHESERPALSVVLRRADISALDFDSLDPSCAVEAFPHRAQFKGSRKTEAFEPIEPLSPSEFLQGQVADMHLADLLSRSRLLTDTLHARASELRRGPTVQLTEPDPEP